MLFINAALVKKKKKSLKKLQAPNFWRVVYIPKRKSLCDMMKNNLQVLMLLAYFTNQTDGDNIKKSNFSADTDIRCH